MHTNSGKKVFHAIMHRRCTSGHSSYLSLPEAVRFHECGTLRYGQAPSGALRHSLKRSASILVPPSQEPRTPSIVSTVFNSPNGPVGPKSPKSPNGPKDGCSLSIPITQSTNFP